MTLCKTPPTSEVKHTHPSPQGPLLCFHGTRPAQSPGTAAVVTRSSRLEPEERFCPAGPTGEEEVGTRTSDTFIFNDLYPCFSELIPDDPPCVLNCVYLILIKPASYWCSYLKPLFIILYTVLPDFLCPCPSCSHACLSRRRVSLLCSREGKNIGLYLFSDHLMNYLVILFQQADRCQVFQSPSVSCPQSVVFVQLSVLTGRNGFWGVVCHAGGRGHGSAHYRAARADMSAAVSSLPGGGL